MELRHLRYFVAVAEEGHVTRAAERLGIQQPPLSQQIQALERELETQLFRRKPRGVELTPAGQALLDEARAILARADEAVAAVKRTARGEAGRIGIGFTSSASFHPFLPRAIRAFREAHPLVALVLEESGTTELVEALRARSLDVAFVRSPVGESTDLFVRPLLEEAMVAALPSGHVLSAARDSLPLAALAGETFILYRRPVGPGLHDAIIAACDRAGFSPTIGQEAPRMLSTLSLVAAGLGVTVVPASMSRLEAEGVAYRPLDASASLTAPLNLAYRRDEISAAVCRFVALVQRSAAS
ncbi:MAG TPA: LysR substrate-binding domain-containing protein [Stellaceae bacterium]|jgi:DNA-binding transcriptional LysR family regulator|nr:LysR substrate-binding domain-containing protein [Stellaceae bacterium]